MILATTFEPRHGLLVVKELDDEESQEVLASLEFQQPLARIGRILKKGPMSEYGNGNIILFPAGYTTKVTYCNQKCSLIPEDSILGTLMEGS